jgi:AhpD family alkylhydroperoxidase
MVSDTTRNELEEYLGTVPSFIEELADPAADHSWGIMRDLELADTELPTREKALVGLGAAAAIQCPYCVHFHREESKMEGVSEEGLKEAVNVASTVRYFSTILHGAEVDMDDFAAETAHIVDHVEEQQATADD